MRTCKRCKTNEAEKDSLNCEKCNERNRKHTAKLIAESKAKNLHIPVVSQQRELLVAFSNYCNSFNIENNCILEDDIDAFLSNQ